MAPARDDAATARTLRRALLSHRAGALLADERPWKLRFALCAQTRRVIAPVEEAALDAEQLVLHAPGESLDDHLELLLTPRGEEVDEALRDRWRIVHADEPRGEVRWTIFDIETARLGAMLADGEEICGENPLRAHEPEMCRRANADRERLARAALALTHSALTAPVAVEAHEFGLMVRHKLGVVLLPFNEEAPTSEDADTQLGALLAKGASA